MENDREVSSQLLATYRWRFNNEDKWKEMNNEYVKKYRDTNPNYPEKNRQYVKSYYENNRDKVLEKKREYYKKKKEQMNAFNT
jgi:hypothetical protein